MDKQKITVRVAGKNYTLVSADPQEYILRVADFAERRLNEMSALTNQSPNAAAVLACIQLSDELLKSQEEVSLLRRQLENIQ